MLLAVNDLTVCYGAITALREVSVAIEPGEIVTLIGANGAGKTTLLRTISGLLKPVSGSVTWCPPPKKEDGDKTLEYFGASRELVGLRPDQIVRLGISHVPEGRQIFADLTVKDNLMLGAFTRRGKKEIEEGLEKCFSIFPVLLERKIQRAGTLSGGEQQMLAVGMALMSRPKALLLDEPTAGLSPVAARTILAQLARINARFSTTVIVVEQNVLAALDIVERVVVLRSGTIVFDGRSSDLKQKQDLWSYF